GTCAWHQEDSSRPGNRAFRAISGGLILKILIDNHLRPSSSRKPSSRRPLLQRLCMRLPPNLVRFERLPLLGAPLNRRRKARSSVPSCHPAVRVSVPHKPLRASCQRARCCPSSAPPAARA